MSDKKKPLPEYKAEIGHYGGYFVMVPAREVPAFKLMFGKSLPRRESTAYKRPEHETFHFSDRSKGALFGRPIQR